MAQSTLFRLNVLLRILAVGFAVYGVLLQPRFLTFLTVIYLAFAFLVLDRWKLKLKQQVLLAFHVFVLLEAAGNIYFDFYRKALLVRYDFLTHAVETAALAVVVYAVLLTYNWWDAKHGLLLVFLVSFSLAAGYEVLELAFEALSGFQFINSRYDAGQDILFNAIGAALATAAIAGFRKS